MSSLLVFNGVYRLEIQSAMLVFSTLLCTDAPLPFLRHLVIDVFKVHLSVHHPLSCLFVTWFLPFEDNRILPCFVIIKVFPRILHTLDQRELKDAPIENNAFLRSYKLAPRPPPYPFPRLSPQQVVYLSQYSCVSPREYWMIYGGSVSCSDF